MYYTKENNRLDRISIPEIVICYYFKKYGIKYEKSRYFDVGIDDGYPTKMTLDFYLSDYNLAIEYDGKQYHGAPEMDMQKDLRVFNIGLSLLRVREDGCAKYYKDDYSLNVDFDMKYCMKYKNLKHFNQAALKRARSQNIINDYDLDFINNMETKNKIEPIMFYLVKSFLKFDQVFAEWKTKKISYDLNFVEIPFINSFKKKAEEAIKAIISFIDNKYNEKFDLSIIDVARDYNEIITQDFIIKK